MGRHQWQTDSYQYVFKATAQPIMAKILAGQRQDREAPTENGLLSVSCQGYGTTDYGRNVGGSEAGQGGLPVVDALSFAPTFSLSFR